LGSASQLYLRGGDRGESDREDCESASQIGLAGSIMSASRRQLEVQADLASITCSPNKRSSFASSETASATISLSERSAGGLSNADDGAASVASTRALAGSILSYKVFIHFSVLKSSFFKYIYIFRWVILDRFTATDTEEVFPYPLPEV